MPRLQVTVVQGRDLAGPAEDNDLYAKLKVCAKKPVLGLNGTPVFKKYKTSRVANSREPVWMETFTVGMPQLNGHRKFGPLTLEVVNYRRFSPNYTVGHAHIDVAPLRKGEEAAQWLTLVSDKQASGAVFIRLVALDFNGSRCHSGADAPPYSPARGLSSSLPDISPRSFHSPTQSYDRPPEYEETESPQIALDSPQLNPMDDPMPRLTPIQNSLQDLIAQIIEVLPETPEHQAESALRTHHFSFERAVDSILASMETPENSSAENTESPSRWRGGASGQSRCRALLVGCTYRGSPGRLSSPVQDVEQVHRLIELTGFEREQSETLILLEGARSHGPTLANVVSGVKWLVGGARPGDVLLFHFSGHSLQVAHPGGEGWEEGLGLEDYQQDRCT
eukprot:TRINITY_DN7349_c0_g1_i1.p1 TRINITY_DN7349_c0_g1~~TRINITY_DN7349_c0_g1_i1.p1  ORF type:complete len:393 (+),score=80.57 TRINITY_DN7349_c0_g1_i1:70-1248(+)